MSVRQYIGARYIPAFADPIQWDINSSYEPLTVVTNLGASYVSKQSVPVGIEIDNENYWILWADYNAQIEAYRQEVQAFDGRIDSLENGIPITDFNAQNTVKDYIDNSVIEFANIIPSTDFDAQNTVKDYIDGFANIIPSTDFDAQNTVKDYIDGFANIIPSTDFDAQNTVKDYIDGFANIIPSTDFDAQNTVKDYIDYELNKNNIPVGYIGIGRTTKNTTPHYIYSPDMQSFIDYGEIENMTFNDSSNLTKYGDYYYDVSNNGYNYSKDFINWTYVPFPFSNPLIANGPIWGTKFCWNIKGGNYCFTSFKYSNTDLQSDFGDAVAFHIYYAQIEQNEDGTITFGQFNLFAPLNQTSNDSYIDPAVCVDETSGNILFVAKDEKQLAPVVYIGTTFGNITKQNFYNQIHGIEAYQLFANARQVFMIGQVYNLHKGLGNVSYPRHYALFVLMNNGAYNNLPKAQVIKQSNDFRHIDFIPIDSISINAIKDKAPIGTPVLYPSSGLNYFDTLIDSTGEYQLYNIPGFCVDIRGGNYTADIYYHNCYNEPITIENKIGTGTAPTINKHDNIDGVVNFSMTGSGIYQILPYVNNSYGSISPLPVTKRTVSGNTDANGNIAAGLNASKAVIIAAHDNGGHRVLPYVYQNYWYLLIIDYSLSPVANTSVTVTFETQ